MFMLRYYYTDEMKNKFISYNYEVVYFFKFMESSLGWKTENHCVFKKKKTFYFVLGYSRLTMS